MTLINSSPDGKLWPHFGLEETMPKRTKLDAVLDTYAAGTSPHLSRAAIKALVKVQLRKIYKAAGTGSGPSDSLVDTILNEPEDEDDE